MPLVRRTALSALVAIALLGSACSDDSSGPGNGDPLVGTWNTTSFTAQGTDFIANGMTLVVTLNADETYAFAVTNDQVGICATPGADCTATGDYAASGSTVTIDAGSQDAVAFSYAIQGTGMTWTGAIDGVPVTITFVRGS